MNGGPRARIDLAALRANLALVRRLAPASRVWSVVKANAYGHGLERVAAALAPDTDGFAVARVEEGLRLRREVADRPVLVLGGIAATDELGAARAARLELALHDPWQVEVIAAGRSSDQAGPPLRVWLKLDTGMGRLGIEPDQADPLVARLRGLGPGVELVGLLTHLANADDPADDLTARQCGLIRELGSRHRLPLSIGNSAGILAHAAARSDWVRPGIMLYGGAPLLGRPAAGAGLRPVMTLTSRLIAVREHRAGDAIGYGGTYRCPEAMAVGIVALGYGDGYPRQAPTGTPVLVRGQRAALIGRVSMDLICLDLRGVPGAAVGDRVTLWGVGLPVEEVAAAVRTIDYELLCRLSPRVRLEYAEAEADSGLEPAA